MSGVTKICDGEALTTNLNFCMENLSKLAAVDALKERNYFALVKYDSTVSLRIYQTPAKEKNVLLRSTEELLAKVGPNLKVVLDVALSTCITEVQRAVVIQTSERTIVMKPTDKEATDVANLMIELRSCQVELSGRKSVRPNKSLARRVSNRLSLRGSKAKSGGSTRRQKAISMKTPVDKMKKELRNFNDVLHSPTYRGEFRQYLKYSFASENLDFYEAVERFEEIPSSHVKERFTMFTQLINQYVRDSAPDQVNLPSNKARNLVDILEAISETTPLDNQVFEGAKKEIYSLMERNFHHAFVVQVEEKIQRQQQIQSMAGSFVKVWRHAGLDGFKYLYETFEPEIERMGSIVEFLKHLEEAVEHHLVALQSISTKFPGISNSSFVPRERSLDRVMHQIQQNLSKQIATLMEFSRDIKNVGIVPIKELRTTVSSGLKGIYDTNLQSVTAINDSRKVLKNAISRESEAFNQKQRIEKEINQSGKKPTKKQQNALAQVNKEFEAARSAREAVEIKGVEVENQQTDAMLTACDMLESLALHRLDSLRDALTQFALAQKSSQGKLELSTRALLFDCMEFDPIGEILYIADKATNV